MRNPYQKLNSDLNSKHSKKIVIVGAEGVGKTQLLHSLIGEEDFDDEYKPTIGATHTKKTIDNVTLGIWDCSGSERFQSLWSSYLRNADQVLLAYDIHDASSLDALKPYLELIKLHCAQAKPVLVGIQKEHSDAPTITKDTIADFAAEHDLHASYHEVRTASPEGSNALRQSLIQSETPDLTPGQEEFLELKAMVREQVRLFYEQVEQETDYKVQEAMRMIANYIERGLDNDNPNFYFGDIKEILQDSLSTLQYSKASLYSTALNMLALTFACCIVVGIPALWLSGHLQNNMKSKGDYFLFSDKGQKQQAEEIINHAVELFRNNKLR